MSDGLVILGWINLGGWKLCYEVGVGVRTTIGEQGDALLFGHGVIWLGQSKALVWELRREG